MHSSDTLYRDLQDHDVVTEYPAVRGMGSDVFFINHANKENGGGDDTVSKHNMYEVCIPITSICVNIKKYSGQHDQRSRKISSPVSHLQKTVQACSLFLDKAAIRERAALLFSVLTLDSS